MDKNDVDKLVKEAEANRDADKKRKEDIDARNMADSSIYQAEKTIKDNTGKFDSKLESEAKEKIDELKKVLENKEVSKSEIDPVLQQLQDILMKIGQEIYSKSTPSQEPTQTEQQQEEE
jgi:molecular chaperone DnaK